MDQTVARRNNNSSTRSDSPSPLQANFLSVGDMWDSALFFLHLFAIPNQRAAPGSDTTNKISTVSRHGAWRDSVDALRGERIGHRGGPVLCSEPELRDSERKRIPHGGESESVVPSQESKHASLRQAGCERPPLTTTSAAAPWWCCFVVGGDSA